MNKIVSNFYLIRLDGEPVYVGYTNRTIKQRFSEHKKDKDFGDIEPTVESLGKLEYDFTWDLGLVNQYAKEVSDRETALVEEYGTQNSVWQKGLGATIGGQTWANVKHFVIANRDNPKFRELDEDIIMELLEWQRKSSIKLKHMVNNTSIKGARKLESIVNDTKVKGARKLKDMVNSTDIKGAQKLKHMVNNTNIKGFRKLESMIKNTKVKGARKLESMVSGTNIRGAQKLQNMVKHTKEKH